MKRNHKIFAGLIGVFLAVGLLSTSLISSNKTTEAEATSSSYWSSWISSNSSAISTGGSTLMSAVKTKISSGTTKISYSGLWAAYKTSDIVPGYESSSDSSKKIWDMYGGIQYTYQSSGSGIDTGTYGGGYNREHSIPNSWWGATEDERYTDLVCLLPTDGKVNGVRSNNVFGVVSGTASSSYAMPQQTDKSGNIIQIAGTSSNNEYSKLGTGKTYASTSPGTVFEPADQYKGDFARIYMYFACRYSGEATSTTEGQKMFKTSYPYVTNYTLELLKLWHVSDPVSEKEINRNDAVESLQGNRNPFVDYPEWANSIFGTEYSSSSSSETLSLDKTTASVTVGNTVTITATASGGSGSVSWSSSDTDIATVTSAGVVTGVAAGTAAITATYGSKTATCTVTVSSSSGGGGTPSGGDSSSVSLSGGSYADSSITWTTADGHTTVTQSKGSSSTAVNSSYISAPRVYKGHVLTFVSDSSYPIYSISITYSGTYYGDSMTAGIAISDNVVTDNTTALSRTWSISSGGTHVVTAISSSGQNTIYIQNVASSSNVQLRPTAISVTYIDSSSSSTHTISLSGSDSVTVGSTITLTATHSGSDTITWKSSNTNAATVSSAGVVTGKASGSTIITASCAGGGTASKTITVNSASAKTLSSIAVSGQTTEFEVGDTFTFDGTVTATFSDSTTSDVTANASFSSPDMSTSGTKTVEVSYLYSGTTKTTSYSITVSESSSEGESTTIVGNIATIASANNWVNTTRYTSFDLDSYVNVSCSYLSSGSNTGKYYSSDSSWRLYQNESATATVSVPSTCYLTSITFTYSIGNSGIFVYGSTTLTSGTAVSISGTSTNSAVFSVGNSGTATNGQIKITNISVTYVNTSSAAVLSSLSLNTDSVTKTFTVNDTFSYSGLVVTAVYSDASEVTLSSGYSVSSPDMTSTGNKEVTVSYTDGSVTKTATYSITVNDASSGDSFKLVTTKNELIEGAKVVIGSSANSSYYAAKAYNSGNNVKSVTATVSNNVLTPGSGYESYIIGIGEDTYAGKYTFKDSSGNYLYAAGTATTGKNYLKSKSALDSDCYWEITITDGAFTIKSVENTYTPYMQFNATSTSLAFACYNTASQTAVQLYADVTAGVQQFVTSYMHLSDYTGDGTGLCLGENGYYYTAKNVLVPMGSAYITEFKDNSTFDDAQARYERWAEKNGDSNPYVIASQAAFITAENNNSGLITTITTIVISTITLGSFFFLKKKKELR